MGNQVSVLLPAAVAVASMAMASYYFLGPTKGKLNPKLSNQSVESSKDSPTNGSSRARRNTTIGRDGDLSRYVLNGKIKTVYELFKQSAESFPTTPCLGTRTINNGNAGPFQFKTFQQVSTRVSNFASGLLALGAKPKECIGIYSKNREEWVLTEQACYSTSLIIVSFYDSLGEDAVQFIAQHAETRFIVASKEQIPRLVKTIDQIAAVKKDLVQFVIQMESDINETHKAQLEKNGVKFYSFEEVERKGQESPHDPIPPASEDLCTIMYTSGTTGDPKGVMITHGNLIAAISGAEQVLTRLIYPGDHYLSYLPLAHIFERVVLLGTLLRGGSVGFAQGDVRKLVDDILELKPALLTGVPRVFDRIYDRIRQTVDQSGGLRQYLFKTAFEAKKNALKNGGDTPFWNLLVFNKLKQRLGGKVKTILSGSAPLTPAVHEFLMVCFGCPVIQGYGLTETCAGATLQLLEDKTVGHVGPPIDCCEIKLVDVPDMEYVTSSNPPRGEVAIRGAQVSLGYYKDQKKTDEDFRNGWFHTGDIGQWNPSGTLSIIDRKKNIFKLSQGEYIAAEKLEGVFKGSKFVAQIFVYGDSTKPTLIALVVPDPERVEQWAKENNVDSSDKQRLLQNPKLVDSILKDITEVGKAAKLRGFEFVKKIQLLTEEFSVDNDLLTPTFKLKRPQLKKRYQKVIDDLYATIQE